MTKAWIHAGTQDICKDKLILHNYSHTSDLTVEQNEAPFFFYDQQILEQTAAWLLVLHLQPLLLPRYQQYPDNHVRKQRPNALLNKYNVEDAHIIDQY